MPSQTPSRRTYTDEAATLHTATPNPSKSTHAYHTSYIYMRHVYRDAPSCSRSAGARPQILCRGLCRCVGLALRQNSLHSKMEDKVIIQLKDWQSKHGKYGGCSFQVCPPLCFSATDNDTEPRSRTSSSKHILVGHATPQSQSQQSESDDSVFEDW